MSLTPFWARFEALSEHWVAEGVSNQRRIPRGTTPPYHRIIFDSEHVEQAPAGMGDLRLFRKRAGRTWNHQVTGGEVAVSLTPFWAGFRALRDHWVAESLWNQRRIPRRATPPYHRIIFDSEHVEQAPSRQTLARRKLVESAPHTPKSYSPLPPGYFRLGTGGTGTGVSPPYHRIVFDSEHVEQAPGPNGCSGSGRAGRGIIRLRAAK